MRSLKLIHLPVLNFIAIIGARFTPSDNTLAGDIKISLLCPTRARPRNMTRMWKSAVQTAKNPENIEIVFYLDNDDTAGMAGVRLVAKHRSAQVRAVIGPRMGLSECWNAVADIARGEIFMQCGDDIIFQSANWDAVVADKISSHPDGIAFVYGRDGYQDEKLGTHGFISRKWAETVGYFLPPQFPGDYSDTWLNEVADKIGRKIYAPEIYTEHMHCVVGKAPRDATYRERSVHDKTDKIHQLYKETAHLRDRDAQNLSAYIAGYSSNKETQT